MGERGPPARPPELMQLEGERPQRINDSAPQPASGWPEPPEGMSEASLRVWFQLRHDLAGTGHVRKADAHVLRAYCDLVVKAQELQALYEQMGPVVAVHKMDKEGELYVERHVNNPVSAQLRDTVAQLRVFAKEIGATPSSRSDIKDPIQQSPTDHTGDFL